MLDLAKVHSEKLNISISYAVITPDEYRFENKMYDTYYILSETNPFIGNKVVQEVSNKKGIAFVAIYPSVNMKKNNLLFESFKSDYLYSTYYQEQIMKKIIPMLERQYRLNKNVENKSIIGINNLAMMSYTIAHDYTTSFYHVYSINLNIKPYKAEFIAYYKSKLDQSVELLIKSDDVKELKDIAVMFGSKSFKELEVNNLNDLILSL